MGNIITLCEAERIMIDLRTRLLYVENVLNTLSSWVKIESQNTRNVQAQQQKTIDEYCGRLTALENGQLSPKLAMQAQLKPTHRKLW